MSGRIANMLFPDPRGRSPTTVPREIAPLLVQVVFEHSSEPLHGRIDGQFSIAQIGAMCEEEVQQPDLRIQIRDRIYQFDQKYLARIWPALFTLPTTLTGERETDLFFHFPGKAVVAIAGLRSP